MAEPNDPQHNTEPPLDPNRLALAHREYAPLQDRWDLPPTPPRSRDDLEAALQRVLGHWLTHQPERLMQTLYRLDLDEREVQDALTWPEADERIQRLATAVVDRELRRLETRRRYQAGTL